VYCTFQAFVTASGWNIDTYYKLRHIFSFSRDIAELQFLELIAASIGGNVFIRADGKRADVNVATLSSAHRLSNYLMAFHFNLENIRNT
jgi:hypothetical protein